MCELFGASLKRKADLKNYLKEFYSHCTMHPHGWGIMSESDGSLFIEKEAVRADRSDNLKYIIGTLPMQSITLAHIRYATVGSMIQENAHPFTALDKNGRRWTLIHNGTIYSGFELMKYLELQKGDTDSERVFMYFMDMVNAAIDQKGELTCEDRFELVEELALRLSARNKFNFMIYDGELLYVHKNMKGTLSYEHDENGYVFSTQPLAGGEGWDSFPLCRVAAYKNGERVFVGKHHNNLFIPTLDYISAFDAMNI